MSGRFKETLTLLNRLQINQTNPTPSILQPKGSIFLSFSLGRNDYAPSDEIWHSASTRRQTQVPGFMVRSCMKRKCPSKSEKEIDSWTVLIWLNKNTPKDRLAKVKIRNRNRSSINRSNIYIQKTKRKNMVTGSESHRLPIDDGDWSFLVRSWRE